MQILSKKGLVVLFFISGIAFAYEEVARLADLAKREAAAKRIAAEEATKRVTVLKDEKKPRACTSTCEGKWLETQKKNIADAEEEAAKKNEEAVAAEKAASIAEAAIKIAEEAAKKRAKEEELAKLTPEERAAREEAERKAAEEAARIAAEAEEAKLAAIADSIAKVQAEEARKIAELNPEMIFVKGSGLTTLGCTKEQGADCNDDERPHQNVTLNDFYISKTPITQQQWERVMGNNPSRFKNCGRNCPVESISWIEVQEFIKKLNSMTGKKYRLLTEAEWEYAARGGGSTKNHKYSGGDNLNQIAWYGANSKQKTQPVCTKKPNELGLCDMTGNVWEWVQDWRGSYPPAGGLKQDPKGPPSGTNRVFRGCSWQDNALYCRVSRRNGAVPEARNSSVGFRLALDK